MLGNYFPSGSSGLWIVLFVVFYEGLLGGAAYVNTFYKITKEVLFSCSTIKAAKLSPDLCHVLDLNESLNRCHKSEENFPWVL